MHKKTANLFDLALPQFATCIGTLSDCEALPYFWVFVVSRHPNPLYAVLRSLREVSDWLMTKSCGELASWFGV